MKITKKDCKSKLEINSELSNKEKHIKREYRRNGYQNMSDKDKQGLKEYQKNVIK